jgi:hypothetical protein
MPTGSVRENHCAKSKTTRDPTLYNSGKQVYYRDKRRSYSLDSSEEKLKENDKISLENFETDTNLDEIKLNYENITKVVEVEEEKIERVVEPDQIEPVLEVVEEEEAEEIKTNIEVVPEVENEEYKTVITVYPDLGKETKLSHNYFREFLEKQKGSKKQGCRRSD